MRTPFAAIALIFALFSGISAQERYVPFVDEAHKDPSFKAFRTTLIAAVKRRDLKHLLSVLDPDIKVSFGGDQGIADFKRLWQVGSPESRLWDELLKVLSNGGHMRRSRGADSFSAPYSFNGFPEDLDVFTHSVIFGNAVALRDTPSLEGRVLTRLSYNIVTVVGEKTVTAEDGEPVPIWFFIRTLGGSSGYVSAKYVRSPIDYRAHFDKKRGKWKMTSFVAGD